MLPVLRVQQELAAQDPLEYKELQVLVLMEPQVFKDRPVHLALLEPMVPRVPPELVLLELLVYKAQLGPVVLPELRAPE